MNTLDIQVVTQADELPGAEHFQRWVDAALADSTRAWELVIRIVDEAESAALNQQYRHKNGPTNILSFPADLPDGLDLECDLLGDMIVCAPVLAREALAQNKPLHDHWAHIIVHGVLHLLGYDHIDAVDADVMEAKEIEILQTLSIPNPYIEVIAA